MGGMGSGDGCGEGGGATTMGTETAVWTATVGVTLSTVTLRALELSALERAAGVDEARAEAALWTAVRTLLALLPAGGSGMVMRAEMATLADEMMRSSRQAGA